MSTIVIVPAYNEGPRIATVIKTVIAAGYRVLVVDDGSVDDTEYQARISGARVLRLTKNGGKGRAMLAGLRSTTDEVVMFVDADLKGLTASHLRMLAEPVERGEFDMVVGGRDHDGGGWQTQLAERLPLISGERAIRRKFLNLMPEKAWSGYGIEVWINDTVARHGGRAAVVTLDGVSIVLRWEKEGAAKGLAAIADMGAEIVMAMQDIVAHYQEAPEPPTLKAKCATTECVADAIAESAAKAFEPLWTPEAQRNVGEGLGSALASPIYGTALGAIGFLAGGWVGLGLGIAAYAAAAASKNTSRILLR